MKEPGALAFYEKIRAISASMLEAARNSDWDAVIGLESQRNDLLDKLMEADFDEISEPVFRKRQADLIEQILKMDLETKASVERWQVELKQILNSVGTEKKLHDAYVGPG